MELLNQTTPCNTCKGTGKSPDHPDIVCAKCNGAGATIDNRIGDILKKHFPTAPRISFGPAIGDLMQLQAAKLEEAFERGIAEAKKPTK